MGSCLADVGEDLEWRTTRKGVIARLKPAFNRIANDSPPASESKDLIASQTKKLGYVRVKHAYARRAACLLAGFERPEVVR